MKVAVTSTENGRVDYLRDDLNTLRREVAQGFERLEAKIEAARAVAEEVETRMSERCSSRREQIYQRLSALEQAQARYFMAGAGTGFILGLVATVFVQAAIKHWVG